MQHLALRIGDAQAFALGQQPLVLGQRLLHIACARMAMLQTFFMDMAGQAQCQVQLVDGRSDVLLQRARQVGGGCIGAGQVALQAPAQGQQRQADEQCQQQQVDQHQLGEQAAWARGCGRGRQVDTRDGVRKGWRGVHGGDGKIMRWRRGEGRNGIIHAIPGACHRYSCFIPQGPSQGPCAFCRWRLSRQDEKELPDHPERVRTGRR